MTFGLFESAISSEQEVGLARQAAVDNMNAAIYDVREKLGPSLFTAHSIEEFRDRVAMMKHDQSIYKVIGAHIHPGASVVRRIAGRGGVLEKEFKDRLAAEHELPGKDVPQGGHASGELLSDKWSPYTMMQRVPGEPGEPRHHRAAGENATVDVKGQYSPSEGELEPEGNFKGYLKSMEQGTPAKVDDNCFTTDGPVQEHTEDPAKHNFASKLAFDLYRDWCTANEMSPLRLSSLDQYATHLPDAQYMRMAAIIQAWDNEHKPKVPGGQSKTKLRDVTAGQHGSPVDRNINDETSLGQDVDRDIWDAQPVVMHKVPGEPGPGRHRTEGEHGDVGGPHAMQYIREHGGEPDDVQRQRGRMGLSSKDPMHRYYAWCDQNGLKRLSARNLDYYAGRNPELCYHLAARMKNAITAARRQACYPGCDKNEAHAKKFHNKESRYRQAAPDYLQKADDALTQLLNTKAQEFQETIAPLQQALVTVQQAEQLQQSQNPLNVLPPPGTVNVMPGGDQGPAGMPAPGAQDLGAAVQALAGGGPGQVPPAGGPPPGADPSGGAPPAAGAPAAGGGGDQGGPPPAAQDPNQVMARRRRAAMPPDYDTGNGQYAPDENDPYQDEHHRDDYYADPRHDEGRRHALYGDSPDAYDEYNPEPSYDVTPHPGEAHDDYHSFDDDWGSDDPNAGGHHVVHGPPVGGGSGKGRGASRPRQAATVHDLWNQWQSRQGQSGNLGIGGEADYQRFADEMGVGPRAISTLKKTHGYGMTGV